MSEESNIQFLVATNIRRRREGLGLSQEALASICKLHRTYIGAVERGEYNITINTLQRIAEALNCTAVDLLSERGEEYAP